MAQNEALPQQLINDAMARSAGSVQDTAAWLWRRLALSLLPIVGENGFHSLYVRNLQLVRESFPWLPQGDVSRPIDFQFTDLKISLQDKNSFEADKASCALLETLIDLLVSLIGEPVTMTILRSAWAGDVSERETMGKEFPHE